MRNTAELKRDTNDSLIGFIKTELDTAMVFANIAVGSRTDAHKRARTEEQARIALEAACRFLRRAQLSSTQGQEIAAKLEELKTRLQELEQKFGRQPMKQPARSRSATRPRRGPSRA